nr:adenylosuccinate lyase [Planctomycetaceae bacterium]
NRRLTLPQSFLAIDASLVIYRNVASGLVVYPKVIESNLAAELPFMATEEILMAGVRAGGDRQDLHERIRVHSLAAAKEVKEEGRPNDLMERLQGDAAFAKVDLLGALDAQRFVGRAPEQVDAFVRDVIAPVRKRYATALTEQKDELRV